MSWADFEAEGGTKMTPALAARVRELRVDQDHTWRMVSERIFAFTEAHPLTQWIEMRGHQPLGMYLCAAAARTLGEDWD